MPKIVTDSVETLLTANDIFSIKSRAYCSCETQFMYNSLKVYRFKPYHWQIERSNGSGHVSVFVLYNIIISRRPMPGFPKMHDVKRAKKGCVGKMYNTLCDISALKCLKTTNPL